MANLIITVISIALVAVAALMGAYYGGQAFMDGQAKSRANRIISEMQQIAGAWHLYASQNGGRYTLTDADWTDGTATDLVPKYLNALPGQEFASNSYPILFLYTLPNGASQNNVNSNYISIGRVSEGICKKVNLIAKGTETVSVSLEGVPEIIANTTPLYCIKGTIDYTVKYKVY